MSKLLSPNEVMELKMASAIDNFYTMLTKHHQIHNPEFITICMEGDNIRMVFDSKAIKHVIIFNPDHENIKTNEFDYSHLTSFPDVINKNTAYGILNYIKVLPVQNFIGFKFLVNEKHVYSHWSIGELDEHKILTMPAYKTSDHDVHKKAVMKMENTISSIEACENHNVNSTCNLYQEEGHCKVLGSGGALFCITDFE